MSKKRKLPALLFFLKVAIISPFFSFSYFSCVGFEEAEASDKVKGVHQIGVHQI